MRFSYFALFFFLLFAACQSQADQSANSSTPAATPPASNQQASQEQYPSIPLELIQDLWNNCDFVDYTFYNLPMSMSFDNKASIQRVLQHLTNTPPVIKDDCKATGRAFFQKQGDDLAVVEFYLHKDCNYFIFLKEGKPTYANMLSPEGAEFYQNSIQQAMGQFQQQKDAQGQ